MSDRVVKVCQNAEISQISGEDCCPLITSLVCNPAFGPLCPEATAGSTVALACTA